MHVIRARNVNEALAQGVDFIRHEGVPEDSRNGPVLRVPEAVSTVYERPTERVLFAPWRDANPFFHLMEALWMIAGRDTLTELCLYVKDFGQFSDDGGVTMPAAYGKRWRDWSPYKGGDGICGPAWNYAWPDQLDWAVKRLRNDSKDRRVVIQMWDPAVDPERADNGGKDVPCNLTMLPKIVGGTLTLTVFCRSNDMLLGAYGANAVHFSLIAEYLAARIGVPVGAYTQISTDFHVYEKDLERFTLPRQQDRNWDYYNMGEVESFPIFQDWDFVGPEDACEADLDQAREQAIAKYLTTFFDKGPAEALRGDGGWPFLQQIAIPMALAHQHWRETVGEERYTGALDILAQMPERNDWRRAGEEWVKRRWERWSPTA